MTERLVMAVRVYVGLILVAAGLAIELDSGVPLIVAGVLVVLLAAWPVKR